MESTALWVSLLLARYQRHLDENKQIAPETVRAFNSLRLADAMFGKLRLMQSTPDHPTQIVVFGPTQSGKSSLINALLNQQATKISALAGFTVHAQGFGVHCEANDLEALEPLMSPLLRVKPDALDADNLGQFVLESVAPSEGDTSNNARVYWDTPDFDSIDANQYSLAVLNAIALADIVVLIVSKDKYGDKSVWDLLQLIAPLKNNLLICINKLDAQDEATVVDAFQSRFSQLLNKQVPAIVTFPFIKGLSATSDNHLPENPLQELRESLHNNVKESPDHQLGAFIDQHKEHWLKPLWQEQQIKQRWFDWINDACDNAEQRYTSEYLNDSVKYDTFTRALAELLTLLEIPGIAPTLARARKLITWPARKLLDVGKSVVIKHSDSGPTTAGERESQENQVLQAVFNDMLNELQGQLLEQSQTAINLAISRNFSAQLPELRLEFATQSQQSQQAFEPHIDAAAQQLYKQLQSQPALLNTLRAARASADAAGIALTIKSGGLAPADLVLAPAMLSVTTLLTESALGRYLETIKKTLKEKQRTHVRTHLFDGYVVPALEQVAEQMPQQGLFTNRLEPELRELLDASDK